ncbi:hypothetical protein YC2023_006134 [Brassica napus]
MTVPYIGTQAWIRSLNYSVIDNWRPWMINNQLAGVTLKPTLLLLGRYTRSYANKMTFATIKARIKKTAGVNSNNSKGIGYK